MSYFDCALIPLSSDKIEAYKTFSEKIAKVYRECGAIRVVDCVLDPEVEYNSDFHAEQAREALDDASLRDFTAAAAAQSGEAVVLSWTEWPSKAVRDDGMKRALADPRVQPVEGEDVLFEGRRLIAGGFLKLFDV